MPYLHHAIILPSSGYLWLLFHYHTAILTQLSIHFFEYAWFRLLFIFFLSFLWIPNLLFYSKINSIVEYDYSDLSTSTAPIYNYLIENDPSLDILIFSGDDDAVCSTLGTQNWVRFHLSSALPCILLRLSLINSSLLSKLTIISYW